MRLTATFSERDEVFEFAKIGLKFTKLYPRFGFVLVRFN